MISATSAEVNPPSFVGCFTSFQSLRLFWMAYVRSDPPYLLIWGHCVYVESRFNTVHHMESKSSKKCLGIWLDPNNRYGADLSVSYLTPIHP